MKTDKEIVKELQELNILHTLDNPAWFGSRYCLLDTEYFYSFVFLKWIYYENFRLRPTEIMPEFGCVFKELSKQQQIKVLFHFDLLNELGK